MLIYIRFPVPGISNHDVEYLVCSPISDILHLDVKKLSDLSQLLLAHSCECRHAFIRAALLQKRTELLPLVILEDNGGVQKIRSALAASSVPTMTKRAGGSESGLPTVPGGCVIVLKVLPYLAL